MGRMSFGDAIESALAQAMADDPRVVVFGEDAPLFRRNLLVRFGEKRVMGTPISEGALVGAAVTAAMAGLRPVVELWMVDFATVAIDALVNHAAKVKAFSGGRWDAPVVVRAACGAGHGDGGQHGQKNLSCSLRSRFQRGVSQFPTAGDIFRDNNSIINNNA